MPTDADWLATVNEMRPAQDALVERHPDWVPSLCEACELPCIVIEGRHLHPWCRSENEPAVAIERRDRANPRWQLRPGEEPFP